MTKITLTPVKSSNIAAIGYQDGTLAVQFSSGAVYHYDGVPPNVFAEMQAAESVGRYFSANIRSQYKGVRQDAAA